VDKRRVRVNQTIEQELEDAFGKFLFNTVIPESTSVTKSQMAGKPLSLFEPRSTVAVAYHKLTTELLNRLNYE